MYQLHRGGELGSLTPQQAYDPATNAGVALGVIGQYSKKGKYASPGALAAAAQRPADPEGYAAAVNALLPKARGILNGTNLDPVWYPPSSDGNGGLGPVRPPKKMDVTALLSVMNANNEILGLPKIESLPTFASQAASVPSPTVGAREAKTPPSKKGGSSIRFLEAFANPFGLTVTSTTGGKHASGSYHYQARAVDFGGASSGMAGLAKAALSQPGRFREVIYTGPGNAGFSILRGKVVPNSQLPKGLYAEHRNHVHLAS